MLLTGAHGKNRSLEPEGKDPIIRIRDYTGVILHQNPRDLGGKF